MKKSIFCLIFFVFLNGIHHVNALTCHFCISVGANNTDCHDPFNANGTNISTQSVRTSDANCNKIVGKLSDGKKFTFRNASSGCLRGLESSAVVGNTEGVVISDITISCCNEHLCNEAISQHHRQPIAFLLFVWFTQSMYFLYGYFK